MKCNKNILLQQDNSFFFLFGSLQFLIISVLGQTEKDVEKEEEEVEEEGGR